MTRQMKCIYKIHRKVDEIIEGVFGRYGKFMANHPLKVISIVSVIEIGLGLGVLSMERESGIEQYAPTGSEASKDQNTVKSLFTVNTSENFYQQSLHDFGLYAEVIVQLKSGGNIFNYTYWEDIQNLITYIERISTLRKNGITFAYKDICARTHGQCETGGNILFNQEFLVDLKQGTVSFPIYQLSTGQRFYLDQIIGGAIKISGRVSSAKALKFRYNLQKEQPELASMWEKTYLTDITSFTNKNISIEYSTSESLSEELSKHVSGDISFFPVSFTLVIIFSCLTLMRINCVDNSYYLGLAGVLSTGLAILGSFGLCSLCGVKFVDSVGAMPFLILGIGVDDMFVLLSAIADTNNGDDVPTRISSAMKISGVAITITSLTEIVVLCVGAASVFPSVSNFCWYTGCAILFCYFNYVTFFVGVMTIIEKRVPRNLHWATCIKLKSNAGNDNENKSNVDVLCCCDEPQKTTDELEAPIEKFPKRVVKRLLLFTPAKIPVLLLFFGYLGLSVWSVTNFRDDLDLRDLVSKDSYYYKFYNLNHNMFSQNLLLSLNIYSPISYRSNSTLTSINSFLENAKKEIDIENDFQISWLHAYMQTPLYDNTSDVNFIDGLKQFLSTKQGNLFINDVTIKKFSVVASRFFVKSTSLLTSRSLAGLMKRLRVGLKVSDLPVFVYSPAFIFFEQYVQIIPQTIQTLLTCILVVCLVTVFFMPLPVLILLVTLSAAMIMVGVIGFMHFWGLTLSSVTMIHIIMCVGFSIDFSARICHAFFQAEGTINNARAATAIDRSGGLILNGAISTIIGVMMLAFSKSFVFFSFFKVIVIVMVIGAMHATLLLPVVLSLVGPNYYVPKTNTNNTEIEISSQKERIGGQEEEELL